MRVYIISNVANKINNVIAKMIVSNVTVVNKSPVNENHLDSGFVNAFPTPWLVIS